jgi:ABC-type polar amino acid transport system ATPase subunit
VSTPVVELTGISKNYGALRPLRIEKLSVAQGEQVAVIGLDQPAAETFISLVTGAGLPDRGEVRVLGRSTQLIADSADWLSTLDAFGIVSDRAVLLEALTVVQNLALPFSLEIEPPTDDVRQRALELAMDVEIADALWDRRVQDLGSADRFRVRLGRALALGPCLLIVEHPTAAVASEAVMDLARMVRAVALRRGIAAITITFDRRFASAVATRTLTLEPVSGRLRVVR